MGFSYIECGLFNEKIIQLYINIEFLALILARIMCTTEWMIYVNFLYDHHHPQTCPTCLI